MVDSKSEQEKRFKEYNKFLTDRGLPKVKRKDFFHISTTKAYEPKYKNGIEIIDYNDASKSPANFKSVPDPDIKGTLTKALADRIYTKAGTKATPIAKIKTSKGRKLIKDVKQTQAQINRTMGKILAKNKKLDVLNRAQWLNKDTKPKGEENEQRVRSFNFAHKIQQEENKKKAMFKFKNPYSRTKEVGHNLRLGQPDGDKGRRLSAQNRKK